MRKMVSFVVLAACGGGSATEADLVWTEAPPPTPATFELDAPATGAIGGSVTLAVSGATPGARVFLLRGAGVGEGSCGTRPGGACSSLTDLQEVAGVAIADASGEATFQVRVPALTPTAREAVFQAAFRDGAATRVSDVARVRASDGTARVRVVHASPDAPAVDVYANGALLVGGLDWLEATPYVGVVPGTYTIDLRAAGAPANSPPVYSVALPLTADTESTAIAVGFLASPSPSDQFRVLALADAWGAPASDAFRVRIVHGSPDAPTVGIDVNHDGSNEVPSLPRFADTGSDGVSLPAGQSLQVAATAQGAIPFTLPAFGAGDRVLAIATGRLSTRPNEPDAFGLLAVGRDGVIGFVRQNPTVHILHASPDAPVVDVKAGAATLADDLGFRELSGTIQVPPGAYDLDLYDASGTTFVTRVTTPSLAAGERYLAVATGFFGGGSPGFQMAYAADTSDLDPGSSVLQILHASPDAPEVEVGAILGGFVPLTAPIGFGEEADPAGIAVAPAAYDLGVALPGGPVLFQFDGVTLPAGARLFAVADGSVGAGTFGLSVVDMTGGAWTTATILPTP